MRDAAGHLAQGAEAFLLHHHLLRPPQFLVSSLDALGEADLIVEIAAYCCEKSKCIP